MIKPYLSINEKIVFKPIKLFTKKKKKINKNNKIKKYKKKKKK